MLSRKIDGDIGRSYDHSHHFFLCIPCTWDIYGHEDLDKAGVHLLRARGISPVAGQCPPTDIRTGSTSRCQSLHVNCRNMLSGTASSHTTTIASTNGPAKKHHNEKKKLLRVVSAAPM